MARTCWSPLAAFLALAAAGTAIQAQELLPMPGCCAQAGKCGSPPAAEDHMVQKTYPVGPLLHTFGCCPSCPDLLIQFMTQSVAPESWSGHGGKGTMKFCPARMALIVRQTPAVQKQVSGLLKAMDKMAAAYAGPMSLVPVGFHVPPPPPMLCTPPSAPASPIEKSASVPEPKQHFRFVLDNLRIRTDEKSIVTIKHVEIEYAGDGIDADVAKCAINGSEWKEKGLPPPCPAPAPSAAKVEKVDPCSEEIDKTEEKSEVSEKVGEKCGKIEPKKVEEDDSED